MPGGRIRRKNSRKNNTKNGKAKKRRVSVKNIAFVRYRIASGFLSSVLENVEQKAYEPGREEYVITRYFSRVLKNTFCVIVSRLVPHDDSLCAVHCMDCFAPKNYFVGKIQAHLSAMSIRH